MTRKSSGGRSKKIRTAVRVPKMVDEERLQVYETDISEDQVAHALFLERSFVGVHRPYLNLQNSLLRETSFQGFECERLLVTDVRFEGCDLSLSRCCQAGFARVEFLNCRLTGMHAVEASFLDVRFVDCSADLSLFRFADLNATRFENCSLREADFQGADLRGVSLSKCDLRQAHFASAQLDRTDLRGSNIEGLKIGAADLRGAIIDSTQLVDHARDFAGFLGLQIED